MVTGATHLFLNALLHRAIAPEKLARLLQVANGLRALHQCINSRQTDLEPGERQALQGELSPHPALAQYEAWADCPDQWILNREDKNYPALLKQIDCPPPLLFVRGQRNCLNNRQIAIVSSRRPTRYGVNLVTKLAGELTQYGITITSGLALGIDGQAHSTAVRNQGCTIAVAGCGLDRVYPARHRKLASEICEQGALVSEFLLGTPPLAYNFPQRNRIISGLTAGTLVIEARVKSGTLITARLAMEQNREVFAVPGPITSSTSAGCHCLIRDGATLVAHVNDLLSELGWQINKVTNSPKSDRANTDDSAAEKLLELIEPEGSVLEELLLVSQIPMGILLTRLLELEVQGRIEQYGGRYYLLDRG